MPTFRGSGAFPMFASVRESNLSTIHYLSNSKASETGLNGLLSDKFCDTIVMESGFII